MLLNTKNITSPSIKLTFSLFFLHYLQLEAYRKRWGWWDEVYLLSGWQQQQCHLTDSKIRFERWSMARGVMAPALQLH
jgi:hypothetical protein